MKSKKPVGKSSPVEFVLSFPTKTKPKKLTKDQKEIEHLKQALRNVSEVLRVPAAEYVPAISDAWDIIDRALKGHTL